VVFEVGDLPVEGVFGPLGQILEPGPGGSDDVENLVLLEQVGPPLVVHILTHSGRLLGGDVPGKLPPCQRPLQNEVRAMHDALRSAFSPQEVAAEGATVQPVDRAHLLQDLFALLFQGGEGGMPKGLSLFI